MFTTALSTLGALVTGVLPLLRKALAWLRGKPWAVAGLAALWAIVATVQGCGGMDAAKWRAEEKRLAAEIARAHSAERGAVTNLAARELALKNKDSRIEDLEEQVRSYTCPGEWVEIEHINGDKERRCSGGFRLDERNARSSSTALATPVLPDPFRMPDALPMAACPAVPRIIAGLGIGPARGSTGAAGVFAHLRAYQSIWLGAHATITTAKEWSALLTAARSWP